MNEPKKTSMSGRPRNFDEDAALDAAAAVFRKLGFSGASTRDLSKAMEMGEQSIYNAFGNKEALFQAALGKYCDGVKNWLGPLMQPDASLPALRTFFAEAVEGLTDDTSSCFAAQTCMSMDRHSDVVADRLRKHMDLLETAFQNAIVNAVERGELTSTDPRAAARYLNLILQGLNVMARSGTPKKALHELIEVALGSLE